MKGSLNNKKLFFKEIGFEDRKIISGDLIHGSKIAMLDKIEDDVMMTDCDALITNKRNCFLTITVADCLPIYFYDRKKEVIAIAHAGWRGVVNNISQVVIKSFIDNYDSDSSDVEVFIGPHIKACHFEIKEDILNQFRGDDIIRREGKLYIDLAKIVTEQLIEVGILKDKIVLSEECTYCLKSDYFSFRRDKPEKLETMLAYIGLK